jgi:hypothetical protein
MRHAREMHAYEVPVHEMHAGEVHTYEMHAHKVQAHDNKRPGPSGGEHEHEFKPV